MDDNTDSSNTNSTEPENDPPLETVDYLGVRYDRTNGRPVFIRATGNPPRYEIFHQGHTTIKNRSPDEVYPTTQTFLDEMKSRSLENISGRIVEDTEEMAHKIFTKGVDTACDEWDLLPGDVSYLNHLITIKVDQEDRN